MQLALVMPTGEHNPSSHISLLAEMAGGMGWDGQGICSPILQDCLLSLYNSLDMVWASLPMQLGCALHAGLSWVRSRVELISKRLNQLLQIRCAPFHPPPAQAFVLSATCTAWLSPSKTGTQLLAAPILHQCSHSLRSWCPEPWSLSPVPFIRDAWHSFPSIS